MTAGLPLEHRLLPMIGKTGVARRDEIGTDTLADRLRSEAIEPSAVIHSPLLVGAWARKVTLPSRQ